MTGRQTPIRKLFQHRFSVMAFGRAAFEGKGGGISRPVAPPIDHLMVREVVRCRLLLNWHRFQFRVVPYQRPEIFRIHLAELLQPCGHTLRFAILKSLGEAIHQIEVRIEVTTRMRAWIFVTFVRPRERAFEDVPEVKDVIAGRQHRVRDVLMHLAKTWPVIKILAGGVHLGVEIMNQPWR